MSLSKRGAALVALLILLTPLLVAQSSGRAVFGWVVANTLTVRNEAVVQAGGLTVSDGGVVISDDGLVLSDDDLTVADDLILTEQSVITVTNGATLTPTGAVQPIASAGAVGFGAITAGTAGQLLVIENTVNQTITITDSATLRLGGNAVLGQFDTLMLLYDGATWVQVSKTDN
jgi:hypothetical protein